MSYRIPLKTVTDPRKITIALVSIYIIITAFLVLDSPGSKGTQQNTRHAYSQNRGGENSFTTNKNIYVISNN